MKYNQGILTKTGTGWAIKDNEEDLLPLDEAHYTPGEDNFFIWNGAKYTEGDIIQFEIYQKYIEPPGSIHCNRGGTRPTAKIVEDWAHIIQTFKNELPKNEIPDYYNQFIEFLNRRYDPPKRILDVKG